MSALAWGGLGVSHTAEAGKFLQSAPCAPHLLDARPTLKHKQGIEGGGSRVQLGDPSAWSLVKVNIQYCAVTPGEYRQEGSFT